MKKYLIIISCLMLLLIGINVVYSTSIFDISIGFITLAVIINTLCAIAIDAIIATLIMIVLPKKWFNPFSKFFKVYSFEKTIYDFLHIKKWKDHIAANIGFNKDKVVDIKNNSYIYLFLQDNCMSGLEHFLSILFGFLIIFIYPLQFIWCFGMPVAIINAVLNLMPVFVQRYNRPKLLMLYKRNKRYTEINTNDNLQKVV